MGLNTLIIKINPGNPIKIVEVNVIISGDAKKDHDYLEIVKHGKSFIGRILNHDDYEQFKNKIYNLALFKGYFDAKFHNSQLIIIPDKCQSIWNINFDSGSRYIFDKIQFKGSQVQNDYLYSLSSMYLGKYYSVDSIMELSRRLFSTNWFESVIIFPDIMSITEKKK